MGDLLGSLVWGVKSRQYCVIGGGSLQMVSEPLPSLRWWERAQAQWRTPAGTLGPKRGWLWRLTSPGNEDMLICINASFMTQRVLKPWWSWTYQNSAAKRASARAISWWVTSWEVWFGESKAELCHWWWVVTPRATYTGGSRPAQSLGWLESPQFSWWKCNYH
jgi:hypothetical protein